jgi:hydroxyethylthiazole kinase-like uncharacterized protein yjeF
MKILSAKQMREADAFTISSQSIDSFSLMERAAAKCAEWISQNYHSGRPFLCICGNGNNGGDGLCISTILKSKGYTVRAIVLHKGNRSLDFTKAYNSAKEGRVLIEELNEGDKLPIGNDVVIIDAIFGTGISRPAEGWFAECIQAINNSQNEIVSIDLPSGLNADAPTSGIKVRARHTLTFQSPKLAFMFAENAESTGNFHVLDIGLSPEYFDKAVAPEFLEREYISSLIKDRKKFSHKGDFGKSLLIAGSLGKMGAAALAAKSCLRSGAGLLTVHVPRCGYEVIQTLVPEAMCTIDKNADIITDAGDVSKYTAIGIGPGIGTDDSTSDFVLSIIGKTKQPMVIDADALNILSANKSALAKLSPANVLTPHPGEFERLAGKSANDFERYKLQREFCETNNVVVVLKGAYTCIMVPGGKTYFNSTGNPAMAKGGAGDVLTGMILGFLSQGYSSEDAAVIAVYLHGLAGDFAAIERSELSVLAGDLVEQIGNAVKHVKN